VHRDRQRIVTTDLLVLSGRYRKALAVLGRTTPIHHTDVPLLAHEAARVGQGVAHTRHRR
jgi:hypothetical protein